MNIESGGKDKNPIYILNKEVVQMIAVSPRSHSWKIVILSDRE